jgi:hypothetical protein
MEVRGCTSRKSLAFAQLALWKSEMPRQARTIFNQRGTVVFELGLYQVTVRRLQLKQLGSAVDPKLTYSKATLVSEFNPEFRSGKTILIANHRFPIIA